ncbi:hypothetical protein SB49_03350 [Sediminicola sp. YIK13]|nr:hypothetical protein SB49_03350 [Sediminicola sp. YIK13]
MPGVPVVIAAINPFVMAHIGQITQPRLWALLWRKQKQHFSVLVNKPRIRLIATDHIRTKKKSHQVARWDFLIWSC